jgi:hypothetical protein
MKKQNYKVEFILNYYNLIKIQLFENRKINSAKIVEYQQKSLIHSS